MRLALLSTIISPAGCLVEATRRRVVVRRNTRPPRRQRLDSRGEILALMGQRLGEVDPPSLSGRDPCPDERRDLVQRWPRRHHVRVGTQRPPSRPLRLRLPVRPTRPRAHRRGERRTAAPPRRDSSRGGSSRPLGPGLDDSDLDGLERHRVGKCPAARRSASHWRVVSWPTPTCSSQTSRRVHLTR